MEEAKSNVKGDVPNTAITSQEVHAGVVRQQKVNVLGRKNLTLNIWGKATLLLGILYQQGLLPNCHIHTIDDGDEYFINGIRVGATEEMVTTCIWLMVESFAAEGHIDFQDNQTIAEAELETGAA